MFSNLPHLREYAARFILEERELSDIEQIDKDARLHQFKETGASLNWTEKEMVTLILRETFARSKS
jgi:uncharacterized linocin/CFP29 family protein